MSKLPFVVQPRVKAVKELIGTDESGVIEIERRGYLTAGEKGFMQVQFSNDKVTKAMLALVRDIARKFGIGQDEAYRELQVCLGISEVGDLGEEILKEFGDRFDELSSLMVEVAASRRLVAAFCMLVYRVNEAITFDEFSDLHPDLIDALANLYEDEESRSTDRIKDSIEGAEVGDAGDAEALEKKSQRATKRSSTSRKPTGN